MPRDYNLPAKVRPKCRGLAHQHFGTRDQNPRLTKQVELLKDHAGMPAPPRDLEESGFGEAADEPLMGSRTDPRPPIMVGSRPARGALHVPRKRADRSACSRARHAGPAGGPSHARSEHRSHAPSDHHRVEGRLAAAYQRHQDPGARAPAASSRRVWRHVRQARRGRGDGGRGNPRHPDRP